MPATSSFEDAFKRAVTPGQGRLLAGVALAAAGRGRKGMVEDTMFLFLSSQTRKC
jgi:hypothetical protein